MKQKLTAALIAAGALAAGIGAPTTAHATSWIPAPCDFVTGGGFVFKDNGERINYGVHGGCKHGEFWGHVNFVDHEDGLHFSSTRITGYVWDPAMPNSRDICGKATVNDSAYEVSFRIHLEDNGEPGVNDKFGIVIDNWNAPTRFYTVSSRKLANGEGGGGNVQLHKSNNSTTASQAMLSLQEWQMCGDLDSPR